MNKYQIGQTLFWFKWSNNEPELMVFDVSVIKQTKDGYKYSVGNSGSPYVNEDICFETVEAAVSYGCAQLQTYLSISQKGL